MFAMLYVDMNHSSIGILQLDVGLRTRDPRWHCERTFELSLGEGKAEIFFIDTNPFIEAYRNMSWAGQVGESSS